MSYDLTSVQADRAITRVWLAVAAFDRAQHLLASKPGSWWERDDVAQMSLTSISEIASIVETFVVESLLDHMAAVCSAVPTQIAEIVRKKITSDVEASWENRKEFSNKWLASGFGSTTWWSPWLGFVTARNAWAHGLGELTDMQMRTEERTKGFLRAAGLEVVDNSVVAKPDDVRRCGLAAVEVIEWVDREVVRGDGER